MCPALNDPELRLTGGGARRALPRKKSIASTSGPTQRALHRRLDHAAFGRPGRALIEDHCDIGSQLRLNVDHGFGREHVEAAVEMRAKRRALLRDRPLRRETE